MRRQRWRCASAWQLCLSIIAQAGLPASAQWDTLSLGMSADLEAAIAAGSTLVRVGSAVFGQR